MATIEADDPKLLPQVGTGVWATECQPGGYAINRSRNIRNRRTLLLTLTALPFIRRKELAES